MAVFIPSKDQTRTHRIDRFRGLNVAVDPTQIAANESPDLLNMHIDTSGALVQRAGYEKVFPNSLGAGEIRGVYPYRKKDGSLTRLLHHGTKLYTWLDNGTQPVEIFNGMSSASDSRSFAMLDNLYILDGTNYLVYNGTTVVPVVGYVPIIRVSTPPAGGGTTFESKNLLTDVFKQSFSGNGTDKTYRLSLAGLTTAPVTASIDSGITFNQVETTHFTVNRVTGVITWITAPPSGVDNVIIQASQVMSGGANRIKQATGHFMFGGANDSRVFVWNGNSLYSSDVYNPAYFPFSGLIQVGRENESITGAVIQYDAAILYKTHSIWSMTYFDDGTRITFPIKPINDSVGCMAPSTVQVINNNGIGLTETGLFELTGGTVRDERNVSPQSRRIDPILLKETNLSGAISIDYNNRYYLAINGKVYVWDYNLPQQDTTQRGEWYLWNNIPASCFYQEAKQLYFGDTTNGILYRFSDSDNGDGYNDDGAPISAYWKSKLEDFGAAELYKTVKKLYYTMKPYTRTAVRVFFIDEDGMTQELGRDGLSLFSYENWSYNNFSYVSSRNPKEYAYKIKAKKITHLQIEFRNGDINERFGVLSVAMTFDVKSYVK